MINVRKPSYSIFCRAFLPLTARHLPAILISNIKSAEEGMSAMSYIKKHAEGTVEKLSHIFDAVLAAGPHRMC